MSDESKDYLRPYRDAVARHGPSFEATLWGSADAQRLRFDVMRNLAGGFDGCVLLDVGCGRGDFAAHLDEHGSDYAAVVGIDAMGEMIEGARARAIPRTAFVEGDAIADADVLDRAIELAPAAIDYACFSGTLNTMDDETARVLIERTFAVARQGVLFNFLSDRPHARWEGRALAPARRFDTLAWIDWALARTSRVDFTQSYLDGHDATVLMRHDD